MRLLVRLVVVLLFASSAMAQFPLDPGESVMTCFSDNVVGFPVNPAAPVVALFDIRNPAANAPPYPTNWNPPHQALATYSQVGEVFGIALDDATPPNIYVTSTSVYYTTVVTQVAPGSGRVFKIAGSGTNAGIPILLTTLPNSGQGLGNIAFDPASKDLFVTNFRDGKIHRINRNSGATVATFDPFAQYNPAFSTPNGYVQPAERIFGIAVRNGRVYYARWAPSEIYSISTSFTGTPVLEFAVPSASSAVVADIEFTTTGDMLVAERGMIGTEVRSDPHHSRAMRFTPSGTTWSLATTYGIGVGAQNASGGIDEICARDGASYVAATGDALHFGPDIYGMQITPAAGGSVNNSFVVDADNVFATQDKTQIGDVDVYNDCDQCAEIIVDELLCTVDGTGDVLLKFRVRNLSPLTAYHAYLVGLPFGVTATQTYFPLTGGLQTGQTSGVLQTRIHNASHGQPLAFKITLLQQNLDLCCAEDVVINVPDCNCAQVTSRNNAFCNFFGGYSYTFTVQNLFNGPDTSYVLITPDTPSTATFTANVFDLTSNPLGYGDSATLTTTIGNAAAGSQVCFLISTHNDNFDECCAIRHCVTLPRTCWWNDWDIDDIIPLGDTVIDFDDGFVTIDSPTNDPGCRFPLAPDTTGIDLEWQPVDAVSPDAFIEQSVEGTVDGGANAVIATARTARQGNSYQLLTSFPALESTRYDYVFLNAGVPVGSASGVGADVPVDCIGCPGRPPQTDVHLVERNRFLNPLPVDDAACPPEDPVGGDLPPCIYLAYTFVSDHELRPRGFTQSFQADEVRVYPQDGHIGDTRLSSLTFRGHGVGAVTFTGLDVEKADGGGNDLDLSLNTGYDQSTNTVLAPGSVDPEWRVTNILTAPVPTRVVIGPVPSWQPPLPGTQWVSVNADSGASIEGRERLSFENCFCIGDGASTASLDLQMRGDDIITNVFLNDLRIGGDGGTFFGAPLNVSFTGAVGASGPFRAGENCVRVEVFDFGRFNTGLNVRGNVRATNGACP